MPTEWSDAAEPPMANVPGWLVLWIMTACMVSTAGVVVAVWAFAAGNLVAGWWLTGAAALGCGATYIGIDLIPLSNRDERKAQG